MPFFPEFPSKRFNHHQYKQAIVTDIVDAFMLYITSNALDILYDVSSKTYYVSSLGETIEDNFPTRTQAFLWVIKEY